MPYLDDFEGYALDALPKYWSDMHGAFSVAAGDAEAGQVLRQQSGSIPPLSTHGGGATAYAVAIGDRSWANYTVAFRVLVEPTPNVSTEDRFFTVGSHVPNGVWPDWIGMFHAPYLLRGGGATLAVWMNGSWTLNTGACDWAASGTRALSGCGGDCSGEWIDVKLSVANLPATGGGVEISASVNGTVLATRTCTKPPTGSYLTRVSGAAFLGTGLHHAQFDAFTVTPTSRDA